MKIEKLFVDGRPFEAHFIDLDLQNLIGSSVKASKYSPSILSKLFKAFMRYHGNDI